MCSKMYVLLSFSGGHAPAFVPASYSAQNNGRSAFTERQNAIFTVHFDRQQKYYTSWPILKGFLN